MNELPAPLAYGRHNQRLLAVARVEVILFDEPTSSLGPEWVEHRLRGGL
ncbi:hypothetical protein MKP05_17400 [Halomonas sp. EGI 63088]|uniref:Uncharacterized protein n=1 Tax=Halomonas flagellata TaxID=2920385 RepID=A0ABS9RYE9_9GAMM|nr:hypothetical protein [Halomonas flagellata]MCH4564876.1 hypothetical protein [Halomonas flagellata]